jgi:hypothetical protein
LWSRKPKEYQCYISFVIQLSSCLQTCLFIYRVIFILYTVTLIKKHLHLLIDTVYQFTPLVFLITKTFKLFVFPIFRRWAYLIKVIPETCCWPLNYKLDTQVFIWNNIFPWITKNRILRLSSLNFKNSFRLLVLFLTLGN